MKTSAETLENNIAKVSVTLDADQVSQAFKKEYKEIAGKYNFCLLYTSDAADEAGMV